MTLDNDRDYLKRLLGQVKRDQVKLLQIVPGKDLPTAFHETAIIAIDQETLMLLDLISFYSLPGLQRKTDAFEDFLRIFNKAEVQLAFANEAWSEATSALASLNLAESPFVGRGEAPDRPTAFDEYLRVELTNMWLKKTYVLSDGTVRHAKSVSNPMAGSWLRIFNESREAADVGAPLDRLNFTFRYENVSSVNILSFTGTAAFFDLSDRPIKSLELTYDVTIGAGKAAVDREKWYQPNPLRDDDQILMSSDLQDVKFRFEVKSIVFADGTRIGEAQ